MSSYQSAAHFGIKASVYRSLYERQNELDKISTESCEVMWNVSYQLFDFYTDAGPEYDGENFVAKVQRRDIGLLGNMALVHYILLFVIAYLSSQYNEKF